MGGGGGIMELPDLVTLQDNVYLIICNFSKMKDISRNLTDHERKAYAEKVAIAFYKSIGGGDSEDEES